MTLNIRSIDALIHRLLEQNSQVNDVYEASRKIKVSIDDVNISIEKKTPQKSHDSKQHDNPSDYHSGYKQADLEARLLRML